MNGFPKEFGEHLINISHKQAQKFSEGLWFIPCLPNEFEQTALHFLNHPNIKVLYNTEVLNADCLTAFIKQVTCKQESTEIIIYADAFIDCSGSGVLCTAINHTLLTDKEYQAAAIVFSMTNIKITDEFSLSFSLLKQITQQIETGIVPEYFNLLSIVPFSLNGDSILFKMGLPFKVETAANTDLETKARKLVDEVAAFIQTTISGFANAKVDWIAKEVGIRTGIRVQGKKILLDQEVLNCTKHNDGICNGAWPIEYWKTGNKKVEMTWFAENDFYTIPADCLTSIEKENFFVAGKIISAEEKAIASARVIGTCLGTGYAAGVLASYKIKNQSQQKAIEFIKHQMLNR